jgi:hypothetical protein
MPAPQNSRPPTAAKSRGKYPVKFSRLASIGCGYMQGYAHGQGHLDLAQRLSIDSAVDLSLSDSSNSRIFRVLSADSLKTPDPTLYVIGLTFLGRWDLPLNKHPREQEGRWVSFQNHRSVIQSLEHSVLSPGEFDNLLDIKLKIEAFSISDRLFDLALDLRNIIHSLRQRDHGCVIFNTADDLILPWLNDNSIKDLLDVPEIIDGLRWMSVPYQFDYGVTASHFDTEYADVPLHHRHTNPGEHEVLNDFLTNYIRKIHDPH